MKLVYFIFHPSYGGLSDLADISVVYSPQTPIGKLDLFLEDSLSALTPDNIATNTLFDATFSSLFVNWNPKAITQMLQSLTRFASYLERKSRSRETVHSNLDGHPSYGGLSDLADISVVYSPQTPIGKLDLFLEDSGFGNQFIFGYEVEVELSIQLKNGNEVELNNRHYQLS